MAGDILDEWDDDLTREVCILERSASGRPLLYVNGYPQNSMTSFDYLARRIEQLKHRHQPAADAARDDD